MGPGPVQRPLMRGSTPGGHTNFPGELDGGLRGPKSFWPVPPGLRNASACSLAPGAPQGPSFSLGLEARAAGWTMVLQPPAEAGAQPTGFCSFHASPTCPCPPRMPRAHRAPFSLFSLSLLNRHPPEMRGPCVAPVDRTMLSLCALAEPGGWGRAA